MTIYLHDPRGRVFTYVVESMHKVAEAGVSEEQRESNARFMGITWRPFLTVVNCWTPDSNTHRVITVARPDTLNQ
jgi:sortase (surface protein transpeptidase)